VRIGELAAQTGLSTKTIRYYEEAGLLPPPVRTSSGYRDYDEEAAKRLAFIRSGQSISLSLGEIREILALRDRGEAPCRYVTGLIEQHAEGLAERVESLVRLQQELTALAERAREALSDADVVDCYCHIIEGRHSGRPSDLPGRIEP